jgi:iduronate 2-sulfatase
MRIPLLPTLLVAAALHAITVPAAEPLKRNVLFIVADDLRTELGCYGSAAKTPHLDALAKRGVVFERAYCQQAVCNPSRSSFLCGRRPDALRLWNNGTHFRELNPDAVTLPEHFKANGFTARCVGKIFHNWHTKEKGDRRSWSADEFLHYANHGDDKPQVKGDLPESQAKLSDWNYGATTVTECRDVPDEAYYDGRVAAEAVRVLKEVKDKPFFLAVGFWKPHAPFNAPKKYWDLYDRAKLPKLDPARPKDAVDIAFHDSREILLVPPKTRTPTAEQAAEMRHGYFANISFMDAQVGKVLAALDELKVRENTVVVFVSDHGYHIGEHTQWGKTSCFEYDARVPLIVATPDGKPGTTKSLAELVDLFPTLTDVCGLKSSDKLDGVSLAPVLKDTSKGVKEVAFTQHPRPAYYDRTESKLPDAMGCSVRTPTHRYTEWRGWKDGKLIGAELYAHDTDPAELTNLANSPDSAAVLKTVRQALHKQFPADTPHANR